MVSLINYINIVKQMLLGGTLKHKDYIDEFTRKYSIPLDPDFYLLEIRAGKIEEIETIEGMDKVYREKVLTNKPLTICSGLRSSCTMESLRGNAYLFVLNIKKIKLRGTESEGMICCTRNDDTIEPLRVFKDPNTKICLENRLELFTDLEYGKIDISKPKYKAALESFSVIENSLCFKGVKVLCDGEYINTKISNGPVS
ncbi:hypothetical protein PAEPH01_2197 [Pancytospora epiphaga]|nr:hypothetical protein PAEPH01_2197 [Pancytospora epiphaga]